MKSLKRFNARLRNFACQRRSDPRLREEMQQHLALQTEENLRSGMPAAEARRQAVLKFGAVEAIREDYHAEQILPSLDSLLQDAGYAVRKLRKSPGFTAIAATSLALAIGANTTVFSAAWQILYARLAVPHAANLRLLTWTGTREHVAVHHVHGGYDILPGGLVTSPVFPYPAYQQLRGQNRVLGDLIGFRETDMNASVRETAQRVLAEMVSGNFYSVLGLKPQLGRAIEPQDDLVASPPVALISDAFWDREFGRSPAVLGQSIKLNDTAVIIIGVNPKNFTGAKSGLQSETPAVMVPLSLQPILTPASDGSSWLVNQQQWWVNVMGRTQPGISDQAAQAALDTQLSAIVRATLPVRKGEDVPRLVLHDGSRGLFEQEQTFAKPFLVLMILVGLVLLLACANIANLMLARSTQRQREMSVRMALGAGRARLLRQMLVESLLLAAIGGAGGLAIGYFGRIALPQLTQNAWQRTRVPLHFDWEIFAFTAVVTLLTGILFGLAPALAAARGEVTHGLKESAHTATQRHKGISGRALVGFQFALSTLLVIVAGLFMRTLAGLSNIEPGFRTQNLLIAELPLPKGRYRSGKDVALHQQLEESIAAIPGVDSVSAAMETYLTDDLSDRDFLPEGEASDAGRLQTEAFNAVGVHFFDTLSIPILAGRAFGPQDTATSPKVGIINKSLAKIRFPKQNPIGRRFSIGVHNADGHEGKLATSLIEIVGVCGDTLYTNLREQPPPQFFVPYAQQTEVGGMMYEIHTQIEPEAILPALRRRMHAIDPELPLVDVRTEDQQVAADLQQERLFVTLTSGFGMLALVLASVGVYGIMAYSVARRTNEIGIRMAVGAAPQQMLAMVLREASGLSTLGIATGVAASLLLSRLLKSMLYGVPPYDPLTLCGATLLLMTVALAATWIPARRAAKVQPIEALRHE